MRKYLHFAFAFQFYRIFRKVSNNTIQLTKAREINFKLTNEIHFSYQDTVRINPLTFSNLMYRQRTSTPLSTVKKGTPSPDSAIRKGHRPITRSFGRDITNTTETMDQGNPQDLIYYQSDILIHLHEAEARYPIHSGYMIGQTDVNEKMRAILVDWLVEV